MYPAQPWKSYRQIATQTAPPGQLVLMLFEGALRFLERALSGFSVEDPGEANMTIHNNVQRAQEIIRELDLALNLEQGGEFAVTLRRLYHYFDRRLTESNIAKERRGVEEVIGHLSVLREAWATMLTQQSAPLPERASAAGFATAAA
ncbi:MAG TPA: flagellar export chaperone FliS [Candidatus Sulfotelmatobacter sp.]|nr:flagellar export chaperone FliS [Candidatus Sulfotelmatobacter sp.]HWI58351.1 flagellar export chaperone FliS [Bacillota bacterium]